MDNEPDKPWLSSQPHFERLPLVLSSHSVKPVIQVPAAITQYLRDYQRDGVRFLYHHFKEGEGGILADDMGLGKTIQAIAFIAAILQMKGTKEDKLRHCSQYIRNDIAPGIEIPCVNPVLIICPASLCDNWCNELETWGYFNVCKVTTANRLEQINRAKRKECDVVITTFESARSSIDQFNSVDWICVLVDEVHRIKDLNSQISKALCSLRCQLRFGFTGTPFQNNLKEVWCLLSWSNPKAIASLSSQTNDVSRLIELGNRSTATKRELAEGSVACNLFIQLRRRLVKRRTKELLAKHLPSKTDQVVFCELTDCQRNIYRMITQSPDVQELLGYVTDDSSKNMKKSKIFKKKTSILFTYLHLLQKTANHLGLLISGLSSHSKELTQELCRTALEKYAGLRDVPQRQWLEALSDVKMSGKMLVLSKLLPVFMEKGDKILIFSYSTKVLDLVENHLKKMRYKHWRLDGTTPPGTRFSLVTKFNTFHDPAIFLLSTKAGGVGLNITGANVVIIYDPNWNPAHDLQAQDRAYRLGQHRDVQVYRLLSTSTIEEFVYLRQVYKQQLGSLTMANRNVRRYFSCVSGDPRYYGELFGIRNLFSFKESGRSLTEELLLKQQHLEEQLRLKMETLSRDDVSKAHISKCAVTVTDNDGDELSVTNKKGGLTQLCEDVFEEFYDDPEEDSNEESMHFDEEEVEINRPGNICTVLERSGAVRHVVEHQNIVAPSTVEDFVEDCAIRDVFQRGINSQLQAFECLVGSEDETAARGFEEHKTPRSLKCRLMFDHIARNELKTPLELATEVLSMVTREKAMLLKRYEKLSLESTPAKKRMQLPSDKFKGDASPEVDSFEEALRVAHHQPSGLPSETVQSTSASVVGSARNIQSDNTTLSPPTDDDSCRKVNDKILALTHDTSSDSQGTPSSSFENDAIALCPNISKNVISLMHGLLKDKSRKCASGKSKPKKSLGHGVKEVNTENKLVSSTKSDSSHPDCKFPCDGGNNASIEEPKSPFCSTIDDLPVPAIDSETGVSVAAVSLLDSLLFSDFKRLPSPKKHSRCSAHSNLEASTSELSHDTHVKSVLNSCVSKNLHDKNNYESESPHFQPEDDIISKLLKSGKLKHV